jgi:RNA polymerase-binding transcription factor DksA
VKAQTIEEIAALDSSFLETCRAELVALRSRLTAEVQSGEQSIVEAAQVSSDGSHLPTHAADQDSGAVESNMMTTEGQAGILDAVNEALERVTTGVFGLCQHCGAPVAPMRLEAIPYTPYCFPCAEKLETG